MDTKKSIKFLIVSGMVLLQVGCAAYNYAPVTDKGSKGDPRATQQVRTSVPNSKVHVVQKGETLYSIAYRYNLSVAQIIDWNDIDRSNTIFPGQQLALASSGVTVDKPATGSLFTLKPPAWWSDRNDKKPAPQAKPKPVAKPKPTTVVTTKPAAPSNSSWNWPVDGPVVKTFDQNDIGRKGVDIAGRVGLPVRAAADGKVVYSGSGLVGYGKLIIIKHDDNYLSAYGFNQKLLVQQGDLVRARQKIAEMGVNLANEPVLHFEIRKNGKPVDPLKFLAQR